MTDLASRKEKKLQEQLDQIKKTNGNSHCLDCSNNFTQYIVVDYLTWVCATCSGIHRSFGHKIRPAVAASFTQEEVTDLQNEGNDAAQENWRARWSPADFPVPDASDQLRVKEFIRQTYVQKMWIFGGKEGGESLPEKKAPAPKERRADLISRSPSAGEDEGRRDFLAGVASTRARREPRAKRGDDADAASAGIAGLDLDERSERPSVPSVSRGARSADRPSVVSAPASSQLSEEGAEDAPIKVPRVLRRKGDGDAARG